MQVLDTHIQPHFSLAPPPTTTIPYRGLNHTGIRQVTPTTGKTMFVINTAGWLPMQACNNSIPFHTELADHAVDVLKQVAADAVSGKRPFFVGVGFHKPHLPFVFPDEYLQLYPESDIRLPDNAYAPVNMPHIAWSSYGELRNYFDIKALHASGGINTTLPDEVVKDLRRAYYSSISYTRLVR